MLSIYCDETWTIPSAKVATPFYVSYGVMVGEADEVALLERLEQFKRRRGLYPPNGKPIEIKWDKAEDEYQTEIKSGKPNRYKEFLDIFFDEVKAKRLSFGYLFLDKNEYDLMQKSFLDKQPDSKLNFFFMLYFQFLYHCFIKEQVKHNPCKILIDSRNMGAEGRQYDLGKLREILNKKIYREIVPKGQRPLDDLVRKQLADSITLVNLAESNQEPLIQMADLCAGCVRFILENQLPPPSPAGQMAFFEDSRWAEPNGRIQLAKYFYGQLRTIKGYDDINLQKPSYHHRFNIFPFHFSR